MATSPFSISLIQHPTTRHSYIILDCPSNDTLPSYIPILLEHKVTDLVRICEIENTYDTAPLEKVGIHVNDAMKFDDGGIPSKEVVESWLKLTEEVFEKEAAVGVHCVSGIGRAPVLVAISLIEEGMDPMDAIQFIRERRRGALNKKQIGFLDIYKPSKKRNQGSTRAVFGGLFGKGKK